MTRPIRRKFSSCCSYTTEERDHQPHLSTCQLLHCCTSSLSLFLISNGFPVIAHSHMLYSSFFADAHMQYFIFHPQRLCVSLFHESCCFYLALSTYVLYLFHYNISLVPQAKQIAEIVDILSNNLCRKMAAMLWSQAAQRFCLQCNSCQNLDGVDSWEISIRCLGP